MWMQYIIQNCNVPRKPNQLQFAWYLTSIANDSAWANYCICIKEILKLSMSESGWKPHVPLTMIKYSLLGSRKRERRRRRKWLINFGLVFDINKMISFHFVYLVAIEYENNLTHWQQKTCLYEFNIRLAIIIVDCLSVWISKPFIPFNVCLFSSK